MRTEKQIAEAIEKNCQEDLSEFELAGIPRTVALLMLVTASAGRLDLDFPNESKERLRDLQMSANEFLKSIEETRIKGRAFGLLNQHLQSLMAVDRARICRDGVGPFLRRYGAVNHNHGILTLLEGFRRFNPNFNCWAALERALRMAYFTANPETDTGRITAGALSKAFERLCKEKG